MIKPTQEYLKAIWDIGLNIVVCPNCSEVIIVERGDEHTCRFCGFTDDISNFSDYFDPSYDLEIQLQHNAKVKGGY
tara:strand:- start:2769 stop:2996 length:228 start_codon:yes stop_codon:yes gene_type:complete